MSKKPIFNLLVVLAFVVALLPAPAALAAPSAQGGGVVLSGAGVSQETAAPPQIKADVDLILDDGSAENNIGIGGTWEFIWLNRFTPDPGAYPFDLNQIQVYFDSGGLGLVGDDIILVVYENTTGNSDPSVGATWLASFPTTIQALNAWNVYDLATPVTLNGPGDVLIGVIALETPGTDYWPAAIDQSSSQGRSWAGWWLSSPPPSPPTLPPDDTWLLIDDAGFPGNWMIRGFGSGGGGPALDLILEENFDGATPAALPAGWQTVPVVGTTPAWATSAGTVHPSGQAAHSEPNLVYFNSWTTSSGNSALLYYDGSFDLSYADQLQVSFWMYHDTGYTNADQVQVQVSTDGGTTWDDVGAPVNRYDGSTGWAQHTVDLGGYVGMSDVMLGFLGISGYGNDVHVDDILFEGHFTPPPCDWEVVTEEHFESWPPAGWTVVDNGGCGVWNTNTYWGRTNYAGGDGMCADADADACGTAMDTELWSPPLNLSAALEASMSFIASYNYLSGDYFEVNVSPDGGVTWDNLLYWAADHSAYGPGETVNLDLTPYIGSNNVIVSFHYMADSWDWWAEVDQVQVSGCYMPPVLLEPAEQMGMACLGDSTSYEMLVTNQSGGDYMFDAAVMDNTWDTSVAPTEFFLTDGASLALNVTVDIPPYAFEGDLDTATVQVVSRHDANDQRAATVTTYAGNMWLPADEGGSATLWPAYANDGTSLFYFDGKDAGGAATDRVQIYTPGAGWSMGSSDGTALYGAVAGYASDGQIYVGGGFEDGMIASGKMKAYDPVADAWTDLSPMPGDLGLGGGGAIDGQFVWVGGSPDSGLITETPVYVYDIATDAWSTGTTLTDVGFTAPGYVVAGGLVYVGGNWLGTDLFYAYDPVADTWTQLANLPGDAGKVSPLFIYDGADEIYVVAGGLAPSEATDRVYRYVISEDAWYESSPVIWPTLGNGGGLLGGHLYTFGGGMNTAAAQAEEGVVPHEFSLLHCPDLDTAILSGYVKNGVTNDPIEGALVEAVGTGVVVNAGTTPFTYTDVNGYYELLLYAPATYDVMASYDDFDPKAENVVVPLTNATQDFVMGPPVANPSPTSYSVTVPWGEQAADTLNLANDGYSVLDFELVEISGGGPFVVGAGEVSGRPQIIMGDEKGLFSASPGPVPDTVPSGLINPLYDVELVVDDGTAEDSIGLTAGGQMIWLNRFTPDPALFPFTLEQISLLASDAQTVGDDMQILVYEDTDGDGDPGTGANLLYSQDVTLQYADYVTWNDYLLDTPVTLNGPGDVILAAVNRSGASGYYDYPATIDETAPSYNNVSWLGSYGGNVPDPPTFPAPSNWGPVESFGFVGNWTLRGYGSLGGSGGGAIVWLAEDPVTGTIPMLDDIMVDLTFDAAMVPSSGTYTGTLNVDSNDPANPSIGLPIEMIVTDNPNAGLLQGTVTTDRPGGPIEGADVHIVGPGVDTVLTTDAAGYYEIMLPPANLGDFDITVSAAGYLDDVQTVPVGAGTTVHDVELELIGSWIGVDPTVLYQDVLWGDAVEDYVDISNAGNQDLDYTINLPGEVLLWEEFEDWPPPGWTIIDNGGCDVWQRNDYWGDPNDTGGAGYCADANSDACGSGMNTELWTPPLDLSTAAGAQLVFKYDYWNYAGEDHAYVLVSPDGGVSWDTVIDWNTDLYGPQTEVVDLTPYVGNDNVIVSFWYWAPGWDWWWAIDEVMVQAAVPAPWLSWTPGAGTVAPAGNDMLTITKDSSVVPMPGVYTAELMVENNDPLEPMIPISITMNVMDNPDQGRIYGTVLGNRTPEGLNMPLEGAHVMLVGPYFFETWTDANGQYEFYLLPSELGDYMVQIEMPGYIISVSAMIPVGPGDAVMHNVTLRALASWLMVDPESIYETLPWGGSTTVPMTVMNPPDATARLNASMMEIMPTFTPLPVQTAQVDIAASPTMVLAEGVVLDDAAAPAAPARSVDVSLLNLALQPMKVLILSDDANQGALDGLDAWLNSYPDLEVDVWYSSDGFPTVADLQPYQTVIFGGRYAFSNAGGEWTAEALGNVMADYVDAGGSVIMIQNAWLIDDVDGAQYALGGRFEAELSPVDYQYSSGETYTYADRALGFHLAGHPLMEDVTSIVDHLRAYTDLAVRPYAETVAYYDDGELYVAANPGKVVLLNQVLTYEWNWEGDVPTLVHNAIMYLAPFEVPWLDETVTDFDLPVGASANTTISLDASVPEVDQPGLYGAWLWFANNDHFQQGAYVPVQMAVEADATMGAVAGTVTMDRHANGPGLPAPNATVMLYTPHGDIELTTDANGQYVHYFTAAELGAGMAMDMMATYPDYNEQYDSAMVYSGQTTMVDFQVQMLAPWIHASPLALEVTIPADTQTTLALDVENHGLADLVIPLIQEIPATATLPLEGAPTSVTWVDKDFAVDAEVANALVDKDATTDFFIWMRERADLSPAYNIGDKDLRHEFVFEALTQTADRSQAEIRSYLDSRGFDYEVFWINNSILVHGGDLAVVETMHGRGDVYRIRGVYTQMSIPDPEQLAIVTLDGNSLNSDPTWNIDIVNAPDVWDQLNVTGEGAVVSNIDTGVRYTHEALNSSYRGNLGGGVYEHNYNWGSLYGGGPTACPGSPTEPCDWAGHGSHTMGTMIGGDGNGAFDMDIGMAPDAQWMACMGCDTPPNGCSDAALTGCAQWVVAPLDLNGNNPDPTMAPDVVNNSWGGGGEDDWYYSYVEAWNAANIIPVFSAGNEGPGCSTLGSPGSYDNVIGMGGTDNADNNYTSTSRGPGSGSGVFPVQKPDLAAPAEGVPSSVNTSDTAYANYSGTSMAAPHMSGLVALMRSVDPDITREEIWDIATANTVTDTLNLKNGTWCGAGPDFPNYVFGYGRIDAFAVVSNVAVEMDIPWLSLDPVSGTVPIAGTMPVEVTFDSTGLETGIYTGTLRILHNDPLGGEVLIPVTMHVEQAPEPAYLIYLPLLTK